MGWDRVRLLLVAVAVLAVLSAVVGGPLGGSGPASTTPENRTSLTFIDGDGAELGTVEATLATTWQEKRTGLSDTESLEPDEGMVFVYEATAERTFVMRDMAFPLDIVFVDGDGTITAIHHAAADSDEHYSGGARWVIEVNRGWTTDHGVTVGDRVEGLPR